MAGMRLDGNVVVSVPVDTGGWALLRCLVQGIRSRLLSDFLILHFKCSHYPFRAVVALYWKRALPCLRVGMAALILMDGGF
jgi:hypothetical protein